MKKIVLILYMLSLLGSYALPPLAAKKKGSLKTKKATRSGSSINQKRIFVLIGGACILAAGSVGVHAWSKNQDPNPENPDEKPAVRGNENEQQKGNGDNPPAKENKPPVPKYNDNASRDSYKFTFLKNDLVSMQQTKTPCLRKGCWGDLTYEKYDYNKNKRVLVNKKGAKDTEERPDTIFYKNNTVSWNWEKRSGDTQKENPVDHTTGYRDDTITEFVIARPTVTHLLLSAGWQGALNLKAGQKVGEVDGATINHIEELLTGLLKDYPELEQVRKISKVTFVQTMDQYKALREREAEELVVIFLRTGDIAGIYNELIKDWKKDVIMGLHMGH